MLHGPRLAACSPLPFARATRAMGQRNRKDARFASPRPYDAVAATPCIGYSRYMDKIAALSSLAALGQETRIDIFRLLVRAGSDGMAAGEIARRLEARQNTVSTHLAVLARTRLIASRREGRSVRYFADMTTMNDLVAYLAEDCCGGVAPVCPPLAAAHERAPR